MANHDETSRYVLEHLRNIFAQMPQRPAAVLAMLPIRKVRVHLTAKMFRKSAALANRGWLRSGSCLLRGMIRQIGNAFFLIQAQRQLLIRCGRPFRAGTVVIPSQLEHHQFQMLDAISASGDCHAKRTTIHLIQITVAAAARNHYAQYATSAPFMVHKRISN